jgi:hypothetical protein
MDIHTDGEFDVDKAAAQVVTQARTSSPAQRAGNLDVIKTAALVDIAGSLRTLALEAALKMHRDGELVTDEQGDDLTGQPIDVGDRVRLRADVDQDPDRPVGTVTAISESEGTEVAMVYMSAEGTVKIWLEELELVPDLGTAPTHDALDELTTDAAANNEPELGGPPVPTSFDDYSVDGHHPPADDIDADFDEPDPRAEAIAAQARTSKGKSKSKSKGGKS